MSQENCWFCDQPHLVRENDIGKCANCHCDIDRVLYEPIIEPLKEEEMLIENKGMLPFFKKGDIEVGTIGVIKTEFKPSGQYLNYTGDVDFGGTILRVSLNKTSLYDIVKNLGQNTTEWIGKKIVYSLEEIETKQGAIYRNVNIFRAVK